MTEYFVQAVVKNFEITHLHTDNKKEAIRVYSNLCEVNPKTKFKIVKRVTTDEVIAESEDVRQARFDFV